ncbi:acyl-CoA-binding domain-containing protein 3 isoform X2 [Carica papaya]|uniref:acyl-CoA-binding domain-containing protein 3 isoform X2 n=1 Tax=Carica papaya TaxID=3649 RepID=UPI000B8CD933|nr:acyl-CoA-binding domain-containing protein 3 isoform X2 [Carica papaya]
MELFLELFFTAIIAVLFSFLVAKLVSVAMYGDPTSYSDSKSGTGVHEVDELQFRQQMKGQSCEGEKKIVFVEEKVEKVDRVCEDSVPVEEETVESAEGGEIFGTKCEELREEVAEKESEVAGSRGVSTEEAMIVEEDIKCSDLNEEGNERKEVEEDVNDVVVEKSEEARTLDTEPTAIGEEKNEELFIEDDDWEGIERSELEKLFAAAAKFVEESGEKGNLASTGNDALMDLYGLHKVATEGPCREPQPMALKVFARAKWNAWQKLGNMNPDVAMEQYIALLSDRIPGWREESSAAKSKKHSTEAEISVVPAPKSRSFAGNQTTLAHGRGRDEV